MGSIIAEVVKWVVKEAVEMVQKGIKGEDVSHHWLMEKMPGELKTVIQDKIKTEQRKAQGLPT